MDSLYLFKGYGQIEDQSLQKPSPAKKHRLIAISAVILLSLAVAGAIVAGTLTRNSTPKSQRFNSAASADSAIRLFCSVTRRPDSCIASMEASAEPPPSSDPESILRLALRISRTEIANFSSSLETVGDAAIRDCRDLMDDAQSRVADSESVAGEDLTEPKKLEDLATWLSAALTDHDTCLDGLEESGSKAFEVVRANMEKSKELTSNALAMVANFHDILEKFDKLKH